MTENKLYAQCREEAREQLKDAPPMFYLSRINRLTAEIYGMKLLDMSQTDNTDWFSRLKGEWHCILDGTIIGSTQDLHDHFVREFNKQQS